MSTVRLVCAMRGVKGAWVFSWHDYVGLNVAGP